MASAITSLTYVPGLTILHKSSIWGKIIMFGLIVAGLLVNYLSMAIAVAVVAALMALSGRWRKFLSLLQYVSPIIVGTVALYAIAAVMEGSSSVGSLIFIGINSARLIASLSLVVTIMSTTDPKEVEAILQRLGWEDLALAVHLTIRMVPSIAIEIENIRTSTRLRGSGSSSLRFLIPVMVNSILRARELADALMLRSRRTLKVPRPCKYDVLLAFMAAMPLVIAVA